MVPEGIESDSEKQSNRSIRSMEKPIPNLNQSSSSYRRHSTGGEIESKKRVRSVRKCKTIDESEDQCSDGSSDENDSNCTSVEAKVSGKTQLVVRIII